jgi:DNA primase
MTAAIKGAVSMEDAARRYGLELQRDDFLHCPFHAGDHTASLKIYPDGRGWYCYGCNQGGDVITFVQKLFGLNFNQTLIRIDNDFGLGLSGVAVSGETAQLVQQRQQEEAERKAHKAAYNKEWEKNIELTKKIDDLSDQVLDLLRQREQSDDWLEAHKSWDKKR